MEKREHGKMCLAREVVMKAMAWILAYQEKTVHLLEMGRSLLMMANEKRVSCSSQTTTGLVQVTDKLLKQIPPVYLGFPFNVEKTVL